MKILFTACVWGDLYSKIFLEFCLGSLMHPSNLSAIAGRCELLIMTDPSSLHFFHGETRDGRIRAIEQWCPIRIECLTSDVPPDALPYPIQAMAHRLAMRIGIEKGAAVSFLVPDGVVANGFCQSLISKLDQGFRAVCGLSMRATLETAMHAIRQKDGLIIRGLPNRTLVGIALEHMHPLFLCSYWQSPRFNKMPYTLLWGGDGHVVARTFALHPYLVVPTEASAQFQGTADSDLPGFYSPEETYIVTDSDDLLVCELAQMQHFAPAFGPGPASARSVAEWAANGGILPSQWKNLDHRFWFHTDDTPPISEWQASDALTVRKIQLHHADKAAAAQATPLAASAA